MLRNICLFFAITCVYGIDNQVHGNNDGNAQIIDYTFNQDPIGNYKYGFSTSNHIQRYEESVIENPNTENASPVVKGSYSYPGSDGKMVKVKYTADKNGFHPEGDSTSVSAYASDNKNVQLNHGGPVKERFNRGYIPEERTQNFANYQVNPEEDHFNADQFAHIIQPHYHNAISENNVPLNNEPFNYDRSLLEFVGSHNQGNNFGQFNNPKPIIAIVGDDGKLIEGNFDNLPESVLELLSKSNIASTSYEKIVQQTKEEKDEVEKATDKTLKVEDVKSTHSTPTTNLDGVSSNENVENVDATVANKS
ncbi:hypothetical protein FQA39_LY11934 [Lamprigera yunnana]|nr:hypothetical protein FQA39_LY11934 [Lamprigera yunnana]